MDAIDHGTVGRRQFLRTAGTAVTGLALMKALTARELRSMLGLGS